MSKFWLLLIMFIVVEALLAFLFSIIAQIFYKRAGIDFKSIAKGIIERLFLTIALASDLTSALTFFSALKLATRLKHEETKEDHNKFNDYYLIGNLASVSMAILYAYVYKNFDHFFLFVKPVNS
jgi:hypothetical protein